MIAEVPPGRFSVFGARKPSWWIFFVLVGALWAMLLLAGLIRGYEPPVGWGTAAAGMPVVLLLWGFLFWMARKTADQHIVVQPTGLLVVIPFRRLIPYDDINEVRRVSIPEPSGELGMYTLLQRKLVPDWNRAPNIEIFFREPVRLNWYPFRWFRLLQLTLDRPGEFLRALPDTVRVIDEVGSDLSPAAQRADSAGVRLIVTVCIIFIALAFAYWVVFGG